MKFSNIINNKINLKDKTYFSLIIGRSPSKGARSPILWNKAYNFFKKKTQMFPADVSEKNLPKICDYLKKDKYFLGSSVTIPHKETILRYLDKIDENAKIIGSVNTIIKNKKKLFGLNTDYLGSLYTLRKTGIRRNKKKIIILGCGGAGKACIISTINFFQKSHILIYNRNQKKLNLFLKGIKNTNSNKVDQINNLKHLYKIKKIDLIINTTSVGFDAWVKDKKYYNLSQFSPLGKVSIKKIKKSDISIFKNINYANIKKNILETFNILKRFENSVIFDIIYQPYKTTLMNIGSLLGYKVINGLDMNFIQAVEAFKKVNNIKNTKQVIKGMSYGK